MLTAVGFRVCCRLQAVGARCYDSEAGVLGGCVGVSPDRWDRPLETVSVEGPIPKQFNASRLF